MAAVTSRIRFYPSVLKVPVRQPLVLAKLLTSLAVVREREIGTLEQLMVTPLSAGELIMGKTIPYIVISLIQMAGVLLFAVYLFDLPIRGSLSLFFLAICLFLMSTLGIGLFISTVSGTQQQAMMTTFFFFFPAILHPSYPRYSQHSLHHSGGGIVFTDTIIRVIRNVTDPIHVEFQSIRGVKQGLFNRSVAVAG